MNFLLIFLIPLCGIVVAVFLVKLFPKAQFSGYDILPFFFIVECQLLTPETKQKYFFHHITMSLVLRTITLNLK